MIKKCLMCNNEFETHTKLQYCSNTCLVIGKSIIRYPNGSDYIECKLCKYRGVDLHKHIRSFHHMSIQQYCNQFNIEEIELQSKEFRKHNSEMQKKAYAEGRNDGWGKGDKNPSKRKEVKEGRMSIFSMNYYKYDGMTDEEKRNEIQKIHHQLAEEKRKKHNNPLTIEYYEKRGYTTKEAKQMLHLRQCTFSLDKCIDKYGEIDGKKRFDARQKKWQTTLNNKPIEEIERINKLKMGNGNGYSKISQKLFDEIVKQLDSNEFSEIFYATNNPNSEFNEYMVHDPITNSNYFLDFYIKDNNKVIEFDGEYWHGEKRGNQKRDAIRQKRLNELGFTKILRIRERDYVNTPDIVVKICIEFIRSI